MKPSRRDLAILLPAMAAAQTGAKADLLPAAAFRYEDLTARKNGTMTSRQMMTGDTHTGYRLDLHETELAAGEMPHAPHRHVHEELLLIREGTLDVTIAGRTTRLGAGSVAYLASNQEHGWKNVGAAPARYFVLALGDDKA
ncbi:MAG: cupin domain-containing protein [Candidatus Solibacter sp.]